MGHLVGKGHLVGHDDHRHPFLRKLTDHAEHLAVIRQLTEDGMTMIIVTHEMGFAHEVAHSVAFMDEGRIVECGPPPAVLDNPKSDRLQSFLRRFRTAQA